MSFAYVKLLGGAAGLLALASYAACSSKEENTPTPVVTDPAKFKPATCGYTVARSNLNGFNDFEGHADVASADPQIRHVRRGLGGEVAKGEPSYADPSRSFSIGWQSDAATKASRIRYGTAPDKLDKTADGFSFVVDQQGKVGPVEGIRFHEVHVCGLEPGRTYHYQVGGADKWSAVYSLTTSPAAGGDAVTIAFAGDTRDALGRSDLPVWRSIATRFKSGNIGLALFSGDMVFSGLDQTNWDSWSKAASAAGPSTFIAIAPGNHEQEMVRSFAHILMPGSTTDHAEKYASFDWGPVHVVMIDDYAGLVNAGDPSFKSEVLAWLESDLTKANANRAAVPWIVTFHHHPLYSDGTRTERVEERKQMQEALQPLYDKHMVDLDLEGHDHFYERFKPLLAGDKEDPKGTVYLLDGAGGAPSYDIKADTPLAAFKTKYDPDAGEGIYGLATVDAASFKVKMYKVSPAGMSSADDTMIDEFALTKKK
jgi:acid phosphatase type 7